MPFLDKIGRDSRMILSLGEGRIQDETGGSFMLESKTVFKNGDMLEVH